MRYLLQQPKTLEKLSLARVGDWIAFQAEKLMTPMSELHECDAMKAEELLSKQIQIIRNCLECNIPSMLHDSLVPEVVRALLYMLNSVHKSEYGRVELRVRENRHEKTFHYVIGRRMIETLFTKNLTFLSFDTWEWFQYGFQDSFYSESHLLTGLVNLKLNSDSMETNIIRLVKELHSLKYLTLTNICTDNILKCIAENCPLIEKLDLSHTDLNDKCIEILMQLPHLRSVDLSDTAVSEKGIETLLMTCENMEHIATNSWQNNAHVLDQIVYVEENAGKKFKLKDYENDDDTTVEQMQLVVKMCPEIRKMNLAKFRSTQSYLMLLNGLRDLRELELMGYDFYADRVKEVLTARGCNLVHLHLEDVMNVDLNALMCICETCPNLQSLIIEECDFLEETFTCQIEIPPFRYLKRLTLKGRESTPTNEQLFFLFTCCPNVEFIFTGITLSDKLMLNILDKNPFSCLKELRMCQSELSVLVIDRIIQNCANHPEVIVSVVYF